ncbi:hypothetical protein [Flavobacterium facile]|jgi:hypothetical protein|uniref:hypothetical protein n=1 Tax=Flavobacterium facile TaxID=2893174 RepID=UPI002E790ECE|nr:hypothetical protein [Flavobacterium sp. T-12]
MKTFFSIIYLPLNSNLQEKISVGLVMSNGEQSIFKVSNPKMQIIKGLISSNKFSILKNYFNNIMNEIEPKIDEFRLNIKSEISNNWINESYFSYLNRYSNNLVIYSEPRNIDSEVTLENFKSIFNKYVFEFDEEVNIIKSEDILSKVRTRLFTKIEDRVNLNVTVSSNDFHELLTPVDVNFIGKNGVIVAGQTIDFVKRMYNLENDLTRYISFTKAVDYSSANKGKYFIVGQEPNKIENPSNHRTWKHVRESHLVEYVDLTETEKIQEYIISKGVSPFFAKVEDSI